MSYLIDKEALYYHFAELEEAAFEQVEKLSHNVDVTDWRIWSAILAERTAYKHDVFDAPVVDAVEVVRCKDCKHNYYNMIPSGEAEHECVKFVELPITADFYCAWGEREDD